MLEEVTLMCDQHTLPVHREPDPICGIESSEVDPTAKENLCELRALSDWHMRNEHLLAARDLRCRNHGPRIVTDLDREIRKRHDYGGTANELPELSQLR